MTDREMESCSDASPWVRRSARWIVWVVLTGVIVWLSFTISSSQTKIREANERLFRIFHGSAKAIVMCDEHGKIVEYNKAAEEMFGWTRSEATGKEVEFLIPPKYRAKHVAEMKKATKDLREVDEDWRITKTGLRGEVLTKDGKEFPVVFQTRGIRYGKNIEFMAVFQRESDIVPKVEAGPLEFPKKTSP